MPPSPLYAPGGLRPEETLGGLLCGGGGDTSERALSARASGISRIRCEHRSMRNSNGTGDYGDGRRRYLDNTDSWKRARQGIEGMVDREEGLLEARRVTHGRDYPATTCAHPMVDAAYDDLYTFTASRSRETEAVGMVSKKCTIRLRAVEGVKTRSQARGAQLTRPFDSHRIIGPG